MQKIYTIKGIQVLVLEIVPAAIKMAAGTISLKYHSKGKTHTDEDEDVWHQSRFLAYR